MHLLSDLKKPAAEAQQTLIEAYGDAADDVNDRERPGKPKKLEDNEFQDLRDDKPVQIPKEFLNSLAVDESSLYMQR